MSKIENAFLEIRSLELSAKEDRFLNRIHPLVKLILTGVFIVFTVSFHKYDLNGLLGMIIYPLVMFTLFEIPFADALRRIKYVLPFVLVVGIFNPFFDRTEIAQLRSFAVTGGMISMLTLMIKAILTVFAAYLLIATTPVESICYAMRKIRIPKILVTEILLIYRYIAVFLEEGRRIRQAYLLRAPGQKGVAFSAWGPLLGQMLLRSVKRAGEVYESMSLRGFTGEFPENGHITGRKNIIGSLLFLAVWLAVFVILRVFPVMEIVGRLFV